MKTLEVIKKRTKKLREESGQALTEFVMIFVLLLFLILMHFQLSMNYVANSYINYATYMAARTNLVSGEEETKTLIQDMLGTTGDGHLSPFAKIGEPVIDETGVEIPYKAYMYVPIIRVPGGKEVEFKSSSKMGREPKNCEEFTMEFDNGC